MISDKMIEKECEALKRSIKTKQQFVDKAPDGRLQCHKEKTYYNWYVSTQQNGKNKRVYIKKSDHKLAEQLALKGLYEQDLRDEKQELRALESFARNRSRFERRERFLMRSDGLFELLESTLTAKWGPEIQDWLKPSEGEPINSDGRKFRCKNGMLVRSKSEQLIVGALDAHAIPFKYEDPLYLGNQLYYPDFKVMNSRTGDEYIWEHFGMMNDPNYFSHNIKKINLYLNSGYVPFVNFIMTFEVKNSGVDIMWIERIIETFLK